ncbi:MAG TPA: hypothetical protein VGK86_16255 [Thermoanaerobaculia bacterium]|jgi:hypothetical protein
MSRRALPVLVLIAAAAIAAGGCRRRGRPDPSIRMAVSHDRESASGGKELSGSVPTKLLVPPEVTAAYSAIQIGWKDLETGKEGVLEVPIGGAAPLPGTDLVIRADVFLPSFSMSAEEITSTGTGQENPAARIAVLQGGNEIFAGWIFKRFPDVHPFQHPRFSLKLEGGVSRKRA